MNKTLLKQIIDIYKDSNRSYLCSIVEEFPGDEQSEVTSFIHEELFPRAEEFLKQFPHDNIGLGNSIIFDELKLCDNWRELNRNVRKNFLNWLYENNI
jgi:hypothetical protein